MSSESSKTTGKAFVNNQCVIRGKKLEAEFDKIFTYYCDQCPEQPQFINYATIREHCQESHAEVKITAKCCGKSLYHRSNMSRHLHLHLQPEDFVCKICNRKYKNPLQLRDHVKLLHTPKEYQCEECGFYFKTPVELDRHRQLEHLRVRPFGCDECGKRFPDRTKLATHQKTHNPDFVPCPQCGKQIKERSLPNHLLTHNEALLKCEDCDYYAKNTACLSSHIKGQHSKTFHCDPCQLAFPSAQKAREHRMTHLRAKTFMCEFCGRQLSTKERWKRHLRSIHKVTEIPAESTAVDPFEIRVEHSVNHANEGIIKTDPDNETSLDIDPDLLIPAQNDDDQSSLFASDDEADIMLGTADQLEDPLSTQCPIKVRAIKEEDDMACTSSAGVDAQVKEEEMEENGFESSSSESSSKEAMTVNKKTKARKTRLDRRERNKETKTHPFACPMCAKGFNNEHLCNTHVRSHTGLYVCEFCPRAFKGKAHYYRHRSWVHFHEYEQLKARQAGVEYVPRERPQKPLNQCPHCAYASPHDITRHVRTHTPSTEHVCQTCQEGFANEKRLRIHMRTHTGLSECEFCGVTFKCLTQYYAHRKGKHREEWQKVKDGIKRRRK